ncbi:hypothetical protein HWV62_21570 [Athelia sp. TMB]|nr:hypothetical protein HWV62_21570 [Athelia sp. TMB]
MSRIPSVTKSSADILAAGSMRREQAPTTATSRIPQPISDRSVSAGSLTTPSRPGPPLWNNPSAITPASSASILGSPFSLGPRSQVSQRLATSTPSSGSSAQGTPARMQSQESRGRGRPGMNREGRMEAALAILRDGRFSSLQLLLYTITETSGDSLVSHRRNLFGTEGRLGELLDVVMGDSMGRVWLRKWMHPHALELTCDLVDGEMDVAREEFRVASSDVTPEYINVWTSNAATGVTKLAAVAPVMMKVLMRAAESNRARKENSKKNSKQLCAVVLAQLTKARSQRANNFQVIFSLFSWSNGCSRQSVNALNKMGLVMAFNTTQKSIEALGTRCLLLAADVADGEHFLAWDNINLSTSIFTEQRDGGPSKTQAGTVGVLYKLRGAKREHMRIGPMLERAKVAKDLTFHGDIRPTNEQSQAFRYQAIIHIIRVLTKHSKHFIALADNPALQHQPRRPLEPGYKTEQFPVRTTTINEASVKGTLQLTADIYGNQLKKTADLMGDKAIPTVVDQLSNARVRGAKIVRRLDTNHWNRLENFQQGFGPFHGLMNLVWGLLNHHRGVPELEGSLTYFFDLLEKKRLAGATPDYHTLLAALTQILEGIILNAWRSECGFNSLSTFAASNPSPQTLLDIADKIMLNHATPTADPFIPDIDPQVQNAVQQAEDNVTQQEEGEESDHDSSYSLPPGAGSDVEDDTGDLDDGLAQAPDIARENLKRLTHDLFYVIEYARALSDGDFGRIEDMLGQLAMIYRGVGCHNYCHEMLYFIHNLKRVWGDEFSNIMRGCMIVNMTGLPGHFMATDLNIEHMIRYLKFLFKSHGLYSSWERLGDISASVDYLMKIKKSVGEALGRYSGTSHTTPNTSSLVWKVADKIRDEKLDSELRNRKSNGTAKPVKNAMVAGEKKLKSSTLKTFNLNVRKLIEGHTQIDDVEDEMLPLGFAAPEEDERPEDDD